MADGALAAMGMAGMSMRWTATDAFLAFVMWTAMMIGMMTPSAAPVLMVFASSSRARRQPAIAVVAFASGYLLVWTAFSAAAAVGQWGLHEAALLTPAMAVTTRGLAAAILIAAGVYQLTPLKRACLAHCRSPLGFLVGHWRDGVAGAFNMGFRHGLYCCGCCWALMSVLFAVGVMNLLWVAALTVFVFAEKFGPAGVVVARASGVAIVAYALLLVSGVV
jgi:predicted metal-binding membrane protein